MRTYQAQREVVYPEEAFRILVYNIRYQIYEMIVPYFSNFNVKSTLNYFPYTQPTHLEYYTYTRLAFS
jgi:hypothetical protein